MVGNLILIVALGAATPALDPERELVRAQAEADGLDYEPALRRLERVLRTLPDDDPIAVRIHLAAGCLAVILEYEDDARAHFAWVLERDPTKVLEGPSASAPKIQAFYEDVRDDVMSRRTGGVVGAIAIAGGAVAILGGASAAFHDGIAGDRDASLRERRDAQTTGLASLAVAGIGVAAAIIGGTWLLWDTGVIP
jgi:hypothetical protein